MISNNLWEFTWRFSKIFEKLPKTFVKIKYDKMNNDSFTCVFQRFQYLMDFTFSVENQIKRWTNVIRCAICYNLYKFSNCEKHPWRSVAFSKVAG